jgi:hypothetical protein
MKKTLREILLERHREADDRLDLVRAQVLTQLQTDGRRAVQGEDRPAGVSLGDWLNQLWVELFWSCRRAWLGLACAWLVILSINFVTTERGARLASHQSDHVPAPLNLLLEERRLLAELAGHVPEPEPAAPPPAPRPRSERVVSETKPA